MSYDISLAFKILTVIGKYFRWKGSWLISQIKSIIKPNRLVDLTSQQKPESTVSRGSIPLGTRLPSYGPTHVPAGINSLVQTPSLCPGMLDRHSWTSFGNDIMEYVISMSSISSLSSVLSIPTANERLIMSMWLKNLTHKILLCNLILLFHTKRSNWNLS